jgi:archaellum component FlaC
MKFLRACRRNQGAKSTGLGNASDRDHLGGNMSADDLNPSPIVRRKRSSLIVLLWLLCVGTTLGMAGNIYQFIRAQRLAQDVDSMQRNTQRQIADMKEAISGVLEQNLLRYDELSKQLQQVGSTTLEQAKSEVNRSRSEFAKTLDRRHQEVVSQLSDLRSDLRQDSSTKLSEISSNLERTDLELKRVVNDLDVVSERVGSSSGPQKTESVVPPAEPAAHDQSAPAAKKKQFWSRLNPFRSGKKKAEAAGDSDE